MPPANKTSEDWLPRPHFGDLAMARRIWEAGNGPTGRAERVPIDLTTMSHIPQSDLHRRVNREFWNIILAMALLAMALLLLAPAAHGATVVIYEHPDGYPYSLYDQWTDMSLTQGIFGTEEAGDTYCNGRHTGSTWGGTLNQYCHGYETQDYLAQSHKIPFYKNTNLGFHWRDRSGPFGPAHSGAFYPTRTGPALQGPYPS